MSENLFEEAKELISQAIDKGDIAPLNALLANNPKICELHDTTGNTIFHYLVISSIPEKYEIIDEFLKANPSGIESIRDLAANKGDVKLLSVILSHDPDFLKIFNTQEKDVNLGKAVSSASSPLLRKNPKNTKPFGGKSPGSR